MCGFIMNILKQFLILSVFYYEYSETVSDTVRFLAPASGSENGIRITDMSVSIDKNGVGKLNVSFSGSGAIEEDTEVVS